MGVCFFEQLRIAAVVRKDLGIRVYVFTPAPYFDSTNVKLVSTYRVKERDGNYALLSVSAQSSITTTAQYLLYVPLMYTDNIGAYLP